MKKSKKKRKMQVKKQVWSLEEAGQTLEFHADTITTLRGWLGIDHVFPVQQKVWSHLHGAGFLDVSMVSKDPSDPLESHASRWQRRFHHHLATRAPPAVLVQAPTGSGKTLAYAVPVVESLRYRRVPALRCLVLVPTRDLVVQVECVFQRLAQPFALQVMGLRGTGHTESIQDVKWLAQQQVWLATDTNTPHADLDHGHHAATNRTGFTNCDILITTPGRLVDALCRHQGSFTLAHLQWFILDEADRLLAQSYNDWLPITLQALDPMSHAPRPVSCPWVTHRPRAHALFHPEPCMSPADAWLPLGGTFSSLPCTTACQWMLFSATLLPEVQSILGLQRCVWIQGEDRGTGTDAEAPDMTTPPSLDSKTLTMPTSLRQEWITCDSPAEKPILLLEVLRKRLEQDQLPALVFTHSIDHAESLFAVVEAYLKQTPWPLRCAYFASSLTSRQRQRILSHFKHGQLDVLLCTDALARGVDFEVGRGVKTVVHYDPPTHIQTHVHRSGRTARAGRPGTSVTLLHRAECRFWKQLMRDHGQYSGQRCLKPFNLDGIDWLEKYQTALESVQRPRKSSHADG